MKLTRDDLRQLGDAAITAATEAGRMIATTRPIDVQHKAGNGSLAAQVVTEIDRRSEDIILRSLGPTLERFELAVLTEEREDDGRRLTADHFWCIDPLDGTLPFIEGAPGSAVSIALVRHDGTPLVGVVFDPATATTYHAISGIGGFRDGAAWSGGPALERDVLSVFADRSFLTMEHHDAVAVALDHVALDMGLTGIRVHATSGAVMNACGVLANPPACYFKLPQPTGGGSLWDFAATACLFHEAGAVATDIHGRALDLNRADSTSMNHRGVLFATDEVLAGRIRALHPHPARS
ncbi:MAG: 3'(2'),5'-bisphosphate nucleotidase CysQ [Ilumatobacter sp.]